MVEMALTKNKRKFHQKKKNKNKLKKAGKFCHILFLLRTISILTAVTMMMMMVMMASTNIGDGHFLVHVFFFELTNKKHTFF
jgi:hypothetical protein